MYTRPFLAPTALMLLLFLAGCEGTVTTVVNGHRTVRHFGHTQAPPPRYTFTEPPPSQRETASHVETLEERQNRLALQLGVSLGVKIGARPDPNDDFTASFLKALASKGADYVIEATIDEAFPEATPYLRRQASNVIEALAEGDYRLETLQDRNNKQAFIEYLQRSSPDAAQSAEIVDFLYKVYIGTHPQ